MNLVKSTLIFMIILFFSQAWSYSPWVPGKDKFYAQLGGSMINPYEQLFVGGESPRELPRLMKDYTIQAYGVYGLNSKFALLASIPYKIVSAGEVNEQNNIPTEEGRLSSLGNIEFGARYNFIYSVILFTGQLKIEAPTGTYDEVTGLRTGYDAWSIEPSVSVGKSINWFYTFLSAGINYKTNDYSTSAKINFEAGYKFFKRLTLTGVLNFNLSFRNGDVVLPIENINTGLYTNDQEYYAYGLKLIWDITKHFGINTGFYGAFDGNNVAYAPSLNGGAYIKF